MDAQRVVELREVRKRYGNVEALKGVEITIHRGEVVAVLGPNGAGKTTSISLMLGLAQPTSGTVRSPYLPSFRYAQLAWTAVGAAHTAPLGTNLFYLGLWTVGLALLAVRAYRREQSRRLA
jgi:ABC-type Na+ transport system ATPase subunit NatA